METILGFSVRLCEVRQLSWRPAQVNRALITSKALQEIRPCRYNQDTSMVGRYGARVGIRGTIVPLPHSATTLGGDHTFGHIEKKHYQQDQRKNRLVKTCRPNSKRTQLSKIVVVFIQ